jgi:hypothetical protein
MIFKENRHKYDQTKMPPRKNLVSVKLLKDSEFVNTAKSFLG